MHPENDFYGHRTVLAEAAGLTEVAPRFRAHVQHGWAAFSPVGHRERLVSSLGYRAWSRADAKVVSDMGVDGVVAIGSPFLYLRRLEGLEPLGSASRPGDGSMLVYPGHGWERERMQGNHARYIDEIHERATGPVTVCLYWTEFRDSALRNLYRDAGFRVISHGTRTDPGFLWRQVEEVLRHDVVTTNHLSTALWYGGALERDIIRFGPEFTIYGEEYRAAWARYQRVRWPEVSDVLLPGDAARPLSEAALGFDSLRPEGELRDLLAPLASDGSPWRRRMTEGSTWAAFTSRRVAAIARSRVRPGRIERRDLERMEAQR